MFQYRPPRSNGAHNPTSRRNNNKKTSTKPHSAFGTKTKITKTAALHNTMTSADCVTVRRWAWLPLNSIFFPCKFSFADFTAADTRRRSDSFPIFRNKKKTKSIKLHGDRKIPIRFRSVTEGTPATGWRQHKDAPNTQKKKNQQNSHLVARQSNNNNSPPEGSQAPNALRLQLEEPAFPENHPPAQCGAGARQFRAFFFLDFGIGLGCHFQACQ